MYEYWLVDDRPGTFDSHGYIPACRYEVEGGCYVFYDENGNEVKRIPTEWVWDLKGVKDKRPS